MTTHPATAALDDALATLEKALLSPVVSGELESWARAADGAARELSRRLPEYLQQVLHPQCDEIARSDNELLTQVQKLRAEDEQTLQRQAALADKLHDFAERAEEIKKHESKVAEWREQLEQEGISLILHIRKQRAAADTWLAEALYRDRGPVD